MEKASSSAGSHLSARFNVGPGSVLLEQPWGGIALEANKLELGSGCVALALIADLAGVDGGQNLGMSATSSMDLIVRVYRQRILDSLLVMDVLWVEIDSLGGFDLVRPRGRGMAAQWQPLLSGWNDGRTRADFLALFGSIGLEILGRIQADPRLPG